MKNTQTKCPMCQGQAYIEADQRCNYQYMLNCTACGYRNYLKLAAQAARQKANDSQPE